LHCPRSGQLHAGSHDRKYSGQAVLVLRHFGHPPRNVFWACAVSWIGVCRRPWIGCHRRPFFFSNRAFNDVGIIDVGMLLLRSLLCLFYSFPLTLSSATPIRLLLMRLSLNGMLSYKSRGVSFGVFFATWSAYLRGPGVLVEPLPLEQTERSSPGACLEHGRRLRV